MGYSVIGTSHKTRVGIRRGDLCLAYNERRGFVLCIFLGEQDRKDINISIKDFYILGSIDGYYSHNHKGFRKESTRYYYIDLDYVNEFGQSIVDYALNRGVDKDKLVRSHSLTVFDIELSAIEVKNFDKWVLKNIMTNDLVTYRDVAPVVDKEAYVRTKNLEIGKIYSNIDRSIFYVYLGKNDNGSHEWVELFSTIIEKIIHKEISSIIELKKYNLGLLEVKSLKKVYELESISINTTYNCLYSIGKLQ